MEIDSLPFEIDQVQRKLLQLRIEEQALTEDRGARTERQHARRRPLDGGEVVEQIDDRETVGESSGA